MRVFEIHITGEEGINQEFADMGLKNIVVELLHPNRQLLRKEYMSSFVIKSTSIHECTSYVNKILKNLKSKVIRTKIECPVYEDYIEDSLYIESHFIPDPADEGYPLSRNQRSGKIMGTDREYNKENYQQFIRKWGNEDKELCMYDSFVEEDKDWFELY